MKFSVKTLFAFLAIVFLVSSCRSSDDDQAAPNITAGETNGLLKIKEFSNDRHIIELYSKSGTTALGYNEIKLRIKDKATSLYEKNASISWKPMMHMAAMMHSSPNSPVEKENPESALYSGYIVFQMPGNAAEYWDLKIDYTIGSKKYSASTVLDVPVESKKTVNSFVGSDNVKYILAYIEPKSPKVATNDLTVGVWKMQDANNFPMVNGYTVKVDPRMPAMGNHSSPNNVHAKQNSAGKLYTGKLAFTMTGYWKINLQLINTEGVTVAGQEVTEASAASSIFFEIDF